MTQQKKQKTVKQFLIENKTRILVGVVVVVALANHGLKKDIKSLKKDNKELQSKVEDHNVLAAQAAAQIEANRPLMDYYFGPAVQRY